MQLKVKFLFVLLGPKNDNIDYTEIGRCIGTLMTNKVHICLLIKRVDQNLNVVFSLRVSMMLPIEQLIDAI